MVLSQSTFKTSYMKKQLKLFFMGIFLIGPIVPNHAAKPAHSEKVRILKEKSKRTQTDVRPNAPSNRSIECTYKKGQIDLTFTGELIMLPDKNDKIFANMN